MAMSGNIAKDFDDYVRRIPKDVQRRLIAMRPAIRQAAPKAEQRISYRMPAFRLGGKLLYFAAFEGHIGYYPGTAAIAAFKKELSTYKKGKGSVRFPFEKPLPLALVTRIAKFRL